MTYQIKSIMKIIIISDIKGKANSIIPYGLEMAKYLHGQVQILHVIDSRSQHGVPSTYADSKSLSPAPKLSHHDILQRERNIAHKAIEKKLSRKASVLNFPLKTEIVIEEDSVRNCINRLATDSVNNLVLINSEPDNYIFHSYKEIIKIAKIRNIQTIIIPPDKLFRKFNKVLMVTNFNRNISFQKHLNTKSFLNDFSPSINAVDIAKSKKYFEKELNRITWLQFFKKTSVLSNIKTNVLTGQDHLNILLSYIKKTKPDLILLNNKGNIFGGNIQYKKVENDLIKNTETPLLF